MRAQQTGHKIGSPALSFLGRTRKLAHVNTRELHHQNSLILSYFFLIGGILFLNVGSTIPIVLDHKIKKKKKAT